MENFDNAGGGASQQQQRRRPLALPLGILFLPTDEVLLTVYLGNKVAGRAPPRGIYIPTCILYLAAPHPGFDPWVLQRVLAFPYSKAGEFYFFTYRTRRGSGFLRTAGSGTWAAKGKNLEVRARSTGELVGHKLMLKFVPKGDGDGRSNWIMHEYRLPSSRGGCRPPSSSSSDGEAKPLQELVLCRIYQRRSSTDKGDAPASSEESEESSVTSPL